MGSPKSRIPSVHLGATSEQLAEHNRKVEISVDGEDAFVYKVIMMDARSNKDKKQTSNGDFLGEEQWVWLEQELSSSHHRIFNGIEERVDLILLGSGIQVIRQTRWWRSHGGLAIDCFTSLLS
jgi:hypothetical protein